MSQATGGIPLFNLTVVDRLPSGLAFVSASDGGLFDSSTGNITWTLGVLNPGQTVTLSYTIIVNAEGDWSNAACASGNDEFANIASDCANQTVKHDMTIFDLIDLDDVLIHQAASFTAIAAVVR